MLKTSKYELKHQLRRSLMESARLLRALGDPANHTLVDDVSPALAEIEKILKAVNEGLSIR